MDMKSIREKYMIARIGGVRNMYGFCEDLIEVYAFPKYRVALRYKNDNGKLYDFPAEISVTLLENKRTFIRSLYTTGNLTKVMDYVLNDKFSDEMEKNILFRGEWNLPFPITIK